MQCSRCHKEITEQQSYVNKGKVYCEDCLMDIGLNKGECDPWATYVDNRTRVQAGQTGTDGLTELEKQVYEFVKTRGKVTRAEVVQELKLTQAELNAQLMPLLHADIIKEKSEGGKQYLVALK
ncbi:MAG: hypothetical protein Q8O43_07810 [Dehalococcoidia bacterium]|nr:hypothetical protein [Dehalococcoidia bacterium]